MKYLILGASGMAGHMISIYLQEHGHDVTGYCRREITCIPSIIGDVKELSLLEKVINEGAYDFIINAVGILNQFAVENHSEAVFINSFIPHYLAEITDKLAARIIHISTDCVFSGETGGYDEYALPDGRTFYDRSKALGELSDSQNITLRNSIIGPDLNKSGIGLLNWFMEQDRLVEGYEKVFWTGLTTLELAKVIENISDGAYSGIYNMVPNSCISKYELLELFNEFIKSPKIIIQKSAKLELHKTLKRTRYDFPYEIPSYEIMVKELSVWMKEHKHLYPHYSL